MSVVATSRAQVTEVTLTLPLEHAEFLQAFLLLINWARNPMAREISQAISDTGVDSEDQQDADIEDEVRQYLASIDPRRGGEDDVMVIDEEELNEEY